MTYHSKQLDSKQLPVSYAVKKLDNLSFSQKLEERTQNFFEGVVLLCKDIPNNVVYEFKLIFSKVIETSSKNKTE